MAVARRVIPFGVSKIVYTSRSETSGIHSIVVVVVLFFCFLSKNVLKSCKSVPPFCWGDNFQSQILKKGRERIRKKSVWGDLKSSCYGYLPGGGLLCFL